MLSLFASFFLLRIKDTVNGMTQWSAPSYKSIASTSGVASSITTSPIKYTQLDLDTVNLQAETRRMSKINKSYREDLEKSNEIADSTPKTSAKKNRKVLKDLDKPNKIQEPNLKTSAKKHRKVLKDLDEPNEIQEANLKTSAMRIRKIVQNAKMMSAPPSQAFEHGSAATHSPSSALEDKFTAGDACLSCLTACFFGCPLAPLLAFHAHTKRPGRFQ
ncbi:hypothetical protein DFH28DRAFT_533283 [Melampsora americana]|nr:hypothetical protein DFH28DRAFT_533283 [Melampsora americana]